VPEAHGRITEIGTWGRMLFWVSRNSGMGCDRMKNKIVTNLHKKCEVEYFLTTVSKKIINQRT
jgi:hypothetical protein